MEDEMETAEQSAVAASESAVVSAEEALRSVAAEDASQVAALAALAALADLDRRIRELEAAIGEVRSVKASAGAGRKTASSMVTNAGHVEGALSSLSVEQRIAVKSGLIRAGLL